MLLAFGLTFGLVFTVSEAILLFGVPFTAFQGLWTEQEQGAMANLDAMADARKKELERWVEERRADVMVQGENPSFRKDVQTLVRAPAPGPAHLGEAGAAGERLREHFGNIQQGFYREYDTIELIDARTGTILVSTLPGAEGGDASQAAYFKAAVNPTVEEVVMMESGENEGSAALVFARAIHGTDPGGEGGLLAVLVFHDPLRNITTSLLHEGIGKTGEIVLVEQDGRLVTPLRYPLPGGATARPQLFVNQAKPARLAAQGIEAGLISEDYRGVEVMAATRHLRVTSEFGWGVVVKMDQSEVLAPIVRTFFFHLVIVAVAVLVCAGVLVLIVAHFTRPFADLNRAASAIEAGDFTVRVSPSGSREMWTVARAFNAMAGRIESWHADLTNEVRKRTLDLSAANKALQESEARFRSLFENVHVVTLLIDPESGAILDANAAAAAYYGWPKEQLQAMTIAEINTLSPEEIQKEITAAAQGKRDYFLCRHRLADGSVKEVEVYSGPIQSGQKTLLCSIVHDITLRAQAEEDRARLEEQLRQAAKMEAVGRLAGGVAHDFNNMLSVILGRLELLKMDFSADNALMQHLVEIEKAANRSKEVTRQLLGFSRKQVIAPRPVDLNDAVAEIRPNLGRLMGEDIEFVLLPGAKLWKTMIDPSQLDQILMNLAVNARDAMPEGGRFILETKNRPLDPDYCREHAEGTPGPYVLLSVSDTGGGMDRETLSHIFEPFFTTKAADKGTGLGLATVFGIVQQNKGFLRVYSEPGQGTTFCIYLPGLGEEGHLSREAAAEEEEAAVRGSETILLVEDEEQVRTLTQRMLEELGYTVVAAASPEEALTLFHNLAALPDLLLTDVIMPGMSGRELHNRLAVSWPGMRAVFISGYTAELLAPHQVLAPGTHFLQKPFGLPELSRNIRAALL